MWILVEGKLANMLYFKQKMPLISGGNFVVLTWQSWLLIFLKMKVRLRIWCTCCLLFPLSSNQVCIHICIYFLKHLEICLRLCIWNVFRVLSFLIRVLRLVFRFLFGSNFYIMLWSSLIWMFIPKPLHLTFNLVWVHS